MLLTSYSVGDKYNRLTIQRIFKKKVGKTGREIVAVECLCSCGNTTQSTITKLKSGETKSCGCYRKEIKTTHNLSYHKLYKLWSCIIQRTTNRNNDRYASYGGRGIMVCESWKKFENFYADMGERPTGTTLDRIDNKKGYCKENCKWSTPEEQMNNMRSNKFLEYDGKRLTIAQWSRNLGVTYCSLATRIRRGWSIEDAIKSHPNKRRLQ